MNTRAAKPKKCRICKSPFTPRGPMQRVCSWPCALEWNRREDAKRKQAVLRELRVEKREWKEKNRTRSEWIKKVQVAFNRFIRLRDAGLPCISCGNLPTQKFGGTMDCGHYRSTGSAPHLRFVEDNAAAQCVECNRHLAGRAVDFRVGLIARIGIARVEAVEADQSPRKYTIADLKEFECYYKQMARALEREKNMKGIA
jgi:hypothetical protein